MPELKNREEIENYYNTTHFEYKHVWNWKLKTSPALHFGYYDENANKHEDAVLRINEIMADKANIKEGSKVLDAGCGFGNSAFWLIQNRNASVTGISIVNSQIEEANKKAQKQNIHGVEFITANYLDTPFADNSFDVVWALESQCHSLDKSLFYKEAYRLLKPGGRLVIADSIRSSRQLSPENEKFLKNIFNAWAVPDIDTLEEHRANAVKEGFVNFESSDISKNMFISYKNLRKMTKKFKRLAEVLKKLRIISNIKYTNYKESGKQADALEKGIFGYHILLTHKPE